MRRASDARLLTSRLLTIWAIISPLMTGFVFALVPSADVTIAAAGQEASYSELEHLGSANDYVQRRPVSANGYEVPLMGMQVRTGWRELKVGQRIGGVEILRVSPDGPSAAVGIRSRGAAVQTALTVALCAGALLFPPATVGIMAVQQSGLGELHDLIIAVDGQRTRNLYDFMRAIGEAEAGQIVYLTVVSEGRRNQIRVDLPADLR